MYGKHERTYDTAVATLLQTTEHAAVEIADAVEEAIENGHTTIAAAVDAALEILNTHEQEAMQ